MIGEPSSWNVTQSTMVNNSIQMGGMMAIIVTIIIVVFTGLVLWWAGSTLPRYKRLWAILNRVSTVIVCAIVGAAVIGVVWIVYILLSELFKAVGGFDPMWILYAIIGFALCATVGAAVLLLAERVSKNIEAANAENPKKSGGDP